MNKYQHQRVNIFLISISSLILFLNSWSALAFQSSSEVNWVSASGITINSDKSLTKTATFGWNDTGTLAANVLPSGSDGSVEFTVTAGSVYAVGFAINKTMRYDNFIASFLINANNQLVTNETYTNTVLGSWQDGDILRIAREGSAIKYYKNGTVIRTVTSDLSYPLMLKAVVHSATVPVLNLSTGFTIELFVQGVETINTNSTASLDVTVTGGNSPYSYQWSSGEQTSSISNKNPGQYSLTVTDASGLVRNRTYTIGRKPKWVIPSGVTENNGGSLTKTANNGWNEIGAYGSDVLSANTDGWIEFIAGAGTNSYMVGLTTNTSMANTNTFIAALYISETGMLQYLEGYTWLSLGSWQEGDIFRLSREGNNIKYYRNGVIIRTMITEVSYHLMPKAVIHTGAVPVLNLSSVFSPELFIRGVETLKTNLTASLDIVMAGGKSPYSYQWSTGEQASSVTNKAEGQYSLTVSDASGLTRTRTYAVGKKTNWTLTSGVTENSGGSLTKTGANGWNQIGAYSSNVLNANTDGWIEFIAGARTNSYMLGLTTTTSMVNSNTFTAAFYILETGVLQYLEGYTWLTLGSWQEGDVFRLSREGGKINYYKNGLLIRSTNVNSSLSLFSKAIINSGTVPALASSVAGNGGGIPDAIELQILKNIYDSLGGANWTNKANWPAPGNWPATATAAQFGTWYGVTVANGDITSLIFTNNNLTGRIPESIGGLSALKTLQLNTDKISGSLPASLNQLVGLTFFYVGSQPQLTGAIPDLSALTRITTFSLRNNGSLTPGPIPSWLMNFTSLTKLDLNGTKRNGSIPVNISSLVNLIDLDLSVNQLTGNIPSSLGSLTKLQTLICSSNQLSGSLPVELGSLANLTSLQFPQNQLTGSLPSTFGNLIKLQNLYLFSNQLTGSIPDSFGDMIELRVLSLNNNLLSGVIPPTLGNLTKLLSLSLQVNQLSGNIPDQLGNLINFNGLMNLSNNQLDGPIPSSFGNLTKLTGLYLNNNLLTGGIPIALSNIKTLRLFSLATNQLSGSIADNLFANMPDLVTLYLNGNSFSGSVPSSIGNHSLLSTIDLSSNNFSGSIPSTFSGLINISSFNIGHNQLGGELPADLFGNWTKLTTITLRQNNFTGPFPSSIGNCSLLTYLRADVNKFTSLPSTLLDPINMKLVNTIIFNDNEIVTIPDFGLHPNKTNLFLNLYTNQLDFSMLRLLVGRNIKSVFYSPQNVIKQDTVGYRCLLTIPSRPPGTNSTITWKKKNGSSYVTVNSSNETPTTFTFTKNHAVLADSGTYTWSMTDTQFAGMTLQSAPIKVRQADLSLKFAEFMKKPGIYCGYDTLVLNSSERGVNYELLRSNVLVGGTTTAGTGSKLSWSGRGFAGSYTVRANDVTCATNKISPAIDVTCQFGDVSVSQQVTVSAMPLTNSNYALVVGGDILSAGLNLKVPSKWPDYVFNRSYPLAPLTEVEDFIKEKGHLPNIPSARELTDAGSYSVGAMDAALLEKVEELTLHLIDIQQNSKHKKSKAIRNNSPALLQEHNKIERIDAITNWQRKNERNSGDSDESIANANVYRADPLPSYGNAVVSDNVLIAPYKSVPSNYKLVVGGNIIASGLDIKAASKWPDYVFEEEYALPSIEELEDYIKSNGHLPGVPAAGEIEKEGIYSASEMDAMLLEKIEWLTLYAIQLKKEAGKISTNAIKKRVDATATTTEKNNDRQIKRNTADLISQSLVAPLAETTSMTFDNVSVSNSLCIACTTVPAGYKLAVGGTILAINIDIKVPHKWPDYVFGKEYELMNLKKVNQFIKKNGHLPNMLSSAEMKTKENYSVSEMDVKLLEKIEELTLYVIELNRTLTERSH